MTKLILESISHPLQLLQLFLTQKYESIKEIIEQVQADPVVTVIITLFMGAQSPDRFMQLTAALLSCEYRLTLAIMKCRVINMFIALLTLFLRVGGPLAMRN